jgi:hypothetical protein
VEDLESSGSAVVGEGLAAVEPAGAGLAGVGLAEAEAADVGAEDGDMGTKSASPKREADCGAS